MSCCEKCQITLSHILQLSMLLLLLFFIIFQMHSLHSCCNPHCKRKTQIHCQETLNAKKFNGHSLFLFFLLGYPIIFILNNHFFEHPIQLIMTFLLFVHVEELMSINGPDVLLSSSFIHMPS